MNKILYSPTFGGYNYSDDFTKAWFTHKGIPYKYVQETEWWAFFEDPNDSNIPLTITEPRHSKELIAFLENYRTKGLNPSGKHADIQIAKIKGNQYMIDEYDGNESVLEPADMDWIIIED